MAVEVMDRFTEKAEETVALAHYCTETLREDVALESRARDMIVEAQELQLHLEDGSSEVRETLQRRIRERTEEAAVLQRSLDEASEKREAMLRRVHAKKAKVMALGHLMEERKKECRALLRRIAEKKAESEALQRSLREMGEPLSVTSDGRNGGEEGEGEREGPGKGEGKRQECLRDSCASSS